MYTIKSSAEFLADVRNLDECLKKARLSRVEIDKKNAGIKYVFICDQTVNESVKKLILAEAEKITPKEFKEVQVIVRKIATNTELINNEIFKFLTNGYPSISIFLKQTDIVSITDDQTVKYTLRLTKDGTEYVQRNGALSKLNSHLSHTFCADFIGTTEEKEPEESIDLLSEEVFEGQLQRIEHRTIKVEDVVIIDDAGIGDVATYIEDVVSGDVIVCGTVVEIVERQAKNNKPFFVIHLDDTTGRISGVYFTKKSTYQHIKCIKEGDAVIVRGNMGEYNGKKSLTFSAINRCTFPSNFVKKDKYKKSTPLEYKTIFPSPAETLRVSSVFDSQTELPSELTDNVYVVFDLETTGIDFMSNGITEIGAVKIVNGKIKEQFTTLVKPDYRISEEIVKLTGITDEMVKDAPKISTVIPDFIKFIDGAILVAHNADFDVRFIKRFAGAEEYDVKNKVIDTCDLSRKCLPHLRKYDLHTIADNFGIIFRHHRALSDAYATSEVFIELMKIKNSK